MFMYKTRHNVLCIRFKVLSFCNRLERRSNDMQLSIVYNVNVQNV